MNKNIYKGIMAICAMIILSACGVDVPDKKSVGDLAESAKQKVTDVAEEGEKMIGASITDMLASGKAITCTWDDGSGVSGVMYVDGDRMRSEMMNVPQVSGETMGTMYTISDGEWMYTWSSDTNEGTKFKLDDEMMEEEISDDGGPDITEDTLDPDVADAMNINDDYTYDCDNWRVDEAMFIAPDNINFIDMNAMMEQMPGNFDLNNVCEMLTGQDKIDCEAQMAQ